MPAVLRNGRGAKPENAIEEKRQVINISSTSQSSQTRPSPYLLLLYPVILAIGSLFSVLSPIAASQQVPTSQSTPLAPGVTSDLNTPYVPAVNYFAGKGNLFNVYFVKIGWFWTTLALVLVHVTSSIIRQRNTTTTRSGEYGSKISETKPSYYLQCALRYVLITCAWILTTQWFFGPALIDRSFTITGGYCEAAPVKLQNTDSSTTKSTPELLDLSFISSGPACKSAGGRWRGGHDISGHVFLLVLSSASLLYELLIADSHSSHPSVTPQAAAKLASNMSEDERSAVGGWESETSAQIRLWARYFLYTVVGLDFWMLMMTAIWFHTWLEKLSGLSLAAVTIWVVYFAPEVWPQWRAIIGGI